jgi:transcriptional regulator with XRE-family HTH domain
VSGGGDRDGGDDTTSDDPAPDDATRGDTPLDIGAFIRAQREMAQLSVRRLAELAEVSNPYLSQIERGLRRPSAEILQQLANGLRISVESLYVRAGILPDDERGPGSVREAIGADELLTDDQKAALLNVYESFVGQRPRT